MDPELNHKRAGQGIDPAVEKRQAALFSIGRIAAGGGILGPIDY